MKTIYFYIIGIIVLVFGCFFLFKLFRKETINDLDITKIKSFYITYSNGYAINSYTRYELGINDGKYVAKIKPYGVSEEDLLEIEVDKSIMDKIEEILKKYEVNKWDGFDKSNQGVLDGDSFSLSVGLKDNKSIHASGYMMWPDHYRDVVNEISPIFTEIYTNEKGK